LRSHIDLFIVIGYNYIIKILELFNLSNYCGNKVYNWKGCGDLCGTYWSRVVKGAEERNLPVGITINDAWDLFLKQNGKCTLSGLDIIIKRGRGNNDWYKLTTASLDRIDSNKGYIVGNIQWVHKLINISKWNLDERIYIDYCYLINTLKNHNLEPIDIESVKHHSNFKGIGNIYQKFWSGICKGAKNRNLPVEITIEEIWNLYIKQNGHCALSGIPIYFHLTGRGSKCHNNQDGEGTASLDRIDSNKGYIKGNIQWVNKYINLMKTNFLIDVFKNLCKEVALYRQHSEDVINLLQPKIFIDKNLSLKKLIIRKPRSTSEFKGVKFIPKRQVYTSQITKEGKNYFLGNFKNPKEAAKNYDYYALKLFEKECYLNFPDFDYKNFIPKKENASITLQPPIKNKNGFWTLEKTEEFLKLAITEYKHFPSQKEIKNFKSGLADAIHKNGGMKFFINKLSAFVTISY
jgi:hypothetical protein